MARQRRRHGSGPEKNHLGDRCNADGLGRLNQLLRGPDYYANRVRLTIMHKNRTKDLHIALIYSFTAQNPQTLRAVFKGCFVSKISEKRG